MPNTNTKLVDSKTIAALFELTPRRIQQLTKEGVIAATKEGNANRYDLLPTIQKYIRYLTAKANGREPSKKDAETEGRRLEAEADLKRSKADIAALQLKELEGTMHRSEDVEAVMTALVYSIRSMLVALPGRLAVDVSSADTAAGTSFVRAQPPPAAGCQTLHAAFTIRARQQASRKRAPGSPGPSAFVPARLCLVVQYLDVEIDLAGICAGGSLSANG